jgi:hypothetical protein
MKLMHSFRYYYLVVEVIIIIQEAPLTEVFFREVIMVVIVQIS